MEAGTPSAGLWSVNPYDAHGEVVRGMASNDSGDLFYSSADPKAGPSGVLTRAAMADGKTLYRYPVAGRQVLSIAVAPDGTLAAVLYDGVSAVSILSLDASGAKRWETPMTADNLQIRFGANGVLWTTRGLLDASGTYTAVEKSKDPMWQTLDYDVGADFISIRGITTGMAQTVTSVRGLDPTRNQKWERPFTATQVGVQSALAMRLGADNTTYVRFSALDVDSGALAYDFGCGSSGPSGFVAISSTGACVWQHAEAPSKLDVLEMDATPEGLLVAHGTQLEILAHDTGKSVATFSVPGLTHFASSPKKNAVYAYGADANAVTSLARIR